MVKRLFLLPFLFLLFFSQPSLAAEFTASVDRTKIGEQDTVTLKLRLNEQVYRGQPDLSVLEEDFRIQGQQRSQQLSFVNGKSESFTEWNIGLLPRRTGTLTIPALSFKGESTQPIIIEVLPPSAEAVEQA
ncbi:MAG TPA: BatD family protein, partial [Pseudomonadales bacterium]|nr:BatD family protein [Pseudomonadales bacterium]